MPRTVRAAVLQGFDYVVRELGADPLAICQQTGLNLQQLDDPDSTIPASLLTQVMLLSAKATSCDHFGLAFAKHKDMRFHLGLLGEIAKSASNLGDALRKLCQLFQLHSESSLWQVQTSGAVSYMTFAQIEGHAESYKQIEQFVMTLLWRFLKVMAGQRWHPYMVHFTFAKPVDLLPYKKIYTVPLMFDADFCGIAFHSSDLTIPLPEHNPSLHENLYQQAEWIKSHKKEDFKETVRLLIRKNLELQLVGEEYVTRFFPFEKRTMQRRLKEQNTSYRELLNEVRINMAMELLANSDISITRIADRLCFSDLANFSKAFTQYTGLSPREWCKKKSNSS